MNIYPDLNNVWNEAIRNALRDRTTEIEKRKEELSELYRSISRLMQMYIYHLGIITDIDPRVKQLLDRVPITTINATRPYKESINGLKANRLVQSLGEAILTDNYDQAYDLALRFFFLCLEYFIDPIKFNELRQALDISLNNLSIPPEYEGFSINRIYETEPLHFKELTREEYLVYYDILTYLLICSADLNLQSIQTNVERIRNELESYYASETEFDRNEEERFLVQDPKLYLRRGFQSQKAELLNNTYVIDSPDDWGSIVPRPRDSILSQEDKKVDTMVKLLIEEYYRQLDEFVGNIGTTRTGIKSTDLEKILDYVSDLFMRWLGNIYIDEFRFLLKKGTKVSAIMRHNDLNWQNSTPLIIRIQELKEKILEILIH